jgi:hypothetical protein
MTALLASALILGIVTGAIARYRGSSFFIWLLVGTLLPGIGLAAVFLMRSPDDEPRRECTNCHAVLPISAQVCMRCGEDLDYPEELIAPKNYSQRDAT